MTQNIFYIHGEYGSSTIFSRMVDDLPDHHAVLADYDCLTGSVDDIVTNLKCVTSDSFDGEPYSRGMSRSMLQMDGRCPG
jgi:hypothetical protein